MRVLFHASKLNLFNCCVCLEHFTQCLGSSGSNRIACSQRKARFFFFVFVLMVCHQFQTIQIKTRSGCVCLQFLTQADDVLNRKVFACTFRKCFGHVRCCDRRVKNKLYKRNKLDFSISRSTICPLTVFFHLICVMCFMKVFVSHAYESL